ncbi:SDR family oxidoreductase [Roseateles oligotrophus]|uniref:SDR family oxidoreductase n=1 Tax=Roseateles oligotrophus TaxID=1769250 RepID=A0ABT2YGS4_9BURK|nr:SDR family oxidoreductase [Roseateles oligotrophus]MCV2369240.1 SDR family oxidoreductase [Roseateles oligotrophus]
MPAPQKFALVTGAGSGVGRACALALIEAGYSVALVGRRLEALQQTAAAAIAPERAFAWAADVTQPEAVAALFERVRAEFGRLDLLFNNAGIGAPAVAVDELTFEQWRAVIDVNLSASFLCAQAAFKLMKRQSPRGGRIINNGSVSAHAPRPNSAPYTASKHAITGLTKALSLDGRAFDIACGQLDIGNALTEMAMPMTVGVRQANGSVEAEATMDVEHAASALLYMAGLPLSANVQFMTVMATKMPFIGRG